MTRVFVSAATPAETLARSWALRRHLRGRGGGEIALDLVRGDRQRLVHQPRQRRQVVCVARRLVLEAVEETAPADLLVHPAFEEGLRGAPQVELGVELAAQAFDV